MADISKISLNGGEYNVRDKVAVLRGNGAPSTSTAGSVGALYEDTTNGDLYICKTVSGSSYVWEKKSQVTVTSTDPGEGASLNAGEFLAVYGSMPDDKLVYAEDPTVLVNPVPWVGTGDVVDNAITNSKINWATIPLYIGTMNGVTGISTSERQIGSVTVVEAGKYIVLANADFNVLGHSVGDAYAAIKYNGSNKAINYFNNSGNWFFGGVTLFTVLDLPANATVTVVAKTGTSTMDVSGGTRASLVAFRVG